MLVTARRHKHQPYREDRSLRPQESVRLKILGLGNTEYGHLVIMGYRK